MKITVTDKKIGKIKPMHAVGQPPIGGAYLEYPSKHFHFLTEANIPYSRLHDVGGYFGGGRFVDIPNIFRNFDADASDPESYDFTFTDALIKGLVENGIEPYYRLGVTIENYAVIKQYNQNPPKDFNKWAEICEHIVAHYVDGWADGFNYNITYWEILNEPDSGHGFNGRIAPMWWGTPEQYYELYDTTAKRLKARFGDRIKVGGYSMFGFYYLTSTEEEREKTPIYKYRMDFFNNFMKYLAEHKTPLDFFSWHSYREAHDTAIHARWLANALKEYGYENTESHLTEWNVKHTTAGTAMHAANTAAMILALQKEAVDLLCLYDAKYGGAYGPLFNPIDHSLWHTYYTLAAFGMLYKLGTEVESLSDTDGVYVVAATDGKETKIMIANVSGSSQPLEISGADLSDARWSIIDDNRRLSWSAPVREMENNTVVLIEGVSF